jgi:Ogr/Delta-like zinc finger
VARINCLHCKEPLRTRSSRQVVPTSIQLNLECTNFDCRATYGGALEITHGIAPSGIPDASVQLRMVPPRRAPVPANDDGAFGASAPEVAPLPVANDNDGCGEAVATGT